jgi:hypothetical protein
LAKRLTYDRDRRDHTLDAPIRDTERIKLKGPRPKNIPVEQLDASRPLTKAELQALKGQKAEALQKAHLRGDHQGVLLPKCPLCQRDRAKALAKKHRAAHLRGEHAGSSVRRCPLCQDAR